MDNNRFSQHATSRIIEGIRRIEKTPYTLGAQYAQYQPNLYGFWAKIEDKYDTTDDDGNPYTTYSWEQQLPINQNLGLQPKLIEDDGTQALQTGAASGNNFAVEVNGNRNVPNGTFVFLRPALNDSYYLFEYTAALMTWAVIQRGTDPNGTAYSWQQLVAQNGGGFAVNPNVGGSWLNPTGWAQDIQGSPFALSNERVLLVKTADFWTFDYQGRVEICNSPSGGLGAGSSDYCIVNTIDSILVYNPWTVAIPGSTRIAISYSPVDTKWYVVAQNCTS